MTTEPHHGVQAPGPGAAGRKPAKRAASPASGTDSYFADLRSLYDELLSHRLADQARTVDAALVALANAQPEDRLEVAMRAFFGLSSTDRRWILMALTDTLPSVLAHRRGQLLALIESRWGDAEIFTPPDPDTKRTVMSMVVVNVCPLGSAIDAAELTTDQAVDIAAAATSTIAQTAARRDSTDPPRTVRRGTP